MNDLCRHCGRPKNHGRVHHPSRSKAFCCFKALWDWQASIDISIKADKIERHGGDREDANP